MRGPSLGTVGSLILNVILSIWLVYQYFYDVYFRAYINSTIGPVYPFIILTMGLGGGSGLGFLLLRRRHPEKSGTGVLQTGRLTRHATPSSSLSSISQSKSFPSGNVPAQPSKHTVYSVPPLAKSPASSGQRIPSSTLWSTSSKQPSASLGVPSFQRSESGVPAAQQPVLPSSLQTNRADQPGKPQPSQFQVQRPDQLQTGSGAKPSVESFARPAPGSQWKPETPASSERNPEGATVYPKPSFEGVQKPYTLPVGQRIPPVPQPSSGFPTPKWQPPDVIAKPGQWTDPVPKHPGFVPPQKWPPHPGAGPTPQTRPPGAGPFRPGQPPQSRGPFPPSQGPPRPLAYPGLLRPPGPGSGGVPGPLRPDQARSTPGPGLQPRPPLQGQRPQNPQGGPTPSLAPQKREPSELLTPQNQPASAPTGQQPSPEPAQPQTTEQKGSRDSASGEMYWDTSLDTILKTLRKDRVVDKS